LAGRAHIRPQGLQIHNRYLVVEGDEGMVVIDQHALHERVLYEQLREKVLAGHVEMQRLLVPEPVTLSPVEAALVLDHQEALGEIGIQIEPFGGDTVLVSGYPAMLQRVSPAEILRQAVELLMSGNGEVQRRDLIDEMLHMMACKAAVKAGDPLSSEEIVSLLEHRELCLDAHHCPHGRPTALVFTREELDKQFGRT
jgi:DNA mismatch repair protein MutL